MLLNYYLLVYLLVGGADCLYGNTTYQSGDSFLDKDGCNTCFCSNGQVGCTLMYCPPEGKCVQMIESRNEVIKCS